MSEIGNIQIARKLWRQTLDTGGPPRVGLSRVALCLAAVWWIFKTGYRLKS